MKYIFSAIAFCGLVNLTACQSNSNTEKAATETQETTQPATAENPHAAGATKTPQAPPLASEAAAQIPAFKFYKVKSGISFTNEDIAKNKNSVFILFDPSCGHCQHETTNLAQNYSKIKDVNIYFVSMNDPALMASFLDTFGKELVDKPNIEVLYDRNQEFIQKFHVPKQFPANYVYGADGSLKSNWDGEKPLDFVLAEFTK
ncbi:TlpA family protein disulfide reductase [Sphingobacterium psychroaquaticum]|uniref:AhpC/TSA family protein n=1 Tax=Sphingobacterium psychroaquaticum TaxID=561061 RepID=A0A1X7JP08_9SPHI|nr:redoxin domain-containing protein [Sphingobacterium psychroaquaticum]QBQ40904.1 redoxin domain-containing protein [Sphingobacterium psychroaquaticum]SMG29695.1 AhpC/TSA family protein [Sphingobacterium psychroaquaticum]